MIDILGRRKLVLALEARQLKQSYIHLGHLSNEQVEILNRIRIGKGWPFRAATEVEFNRASLAHMLKRIDVDGLTPEEVALLAEHALHIRSRLYADKNGRAILEYPEKLDFGLGGFTAQGILFDGDDWRAPRLYGVIPRGWEGRK